MNVIDAPIYFFLFAGLYFQIFLLVTFFENKGKNEKSLSKHSRLQPHHLEGFSEYPTVAITVPCFNEEKTLTKTILSLLALEYPKDKLEILIVDDGSTDGTYAVAEKLVQHYPHIRLIRQKNGGKHTAVNLGISSTRADFVTCLDADSEIASNALHLMLPYFKDPKIGAVTPAIKVTPPHNILQLAQRVEYDMGIFIKRIFGQLNAIYVTPGPFSVFRRKIFDEIGLFKKAHNTEDMEIAFRIHLNGYKIANCHNAYVSTVTPPTLKTLHRQRVRWVTGFMKNCIDYSHVVLNKRFGNMAMFALPFAVLSILGTMYMVSVQVITTSQSLYDRYTQIAHVGWDFSLPRFLTDWYFINTGAVAIIGLILFCLMILIINMSHYMVDGKLQPPRNILYFLIVYAVCTPVWLGKSLYDTILWKKTPWR